MKAILIANSSPREQEELEQVVGRDYNVTGITGPDALTVSPADFDLILLDHNFTESAGIDFLMRVMKECYLPVLMITPEHDPQCAIEAIRVGAYNYIVKTEGYEQILNISIKEAISKFNEREEMKQTILDLRKRVAELEKQLGIRPRQERKVSAPRPAAPGLQADKPSVIEEIIARFKRGDINLPTLPGIITGFNDTIRKGASIADVANLLRQDVGISTRLINVSNTVFYKGAAENKTLEDAISRLGLSTTRQYVYAIANRSLYVTANPEYSKHLKSLWLHSLACASAAQITVENLKLEFKSDAFTFALLHDVGKLILLEIIGELALKEEIFKNIKNVELHAILEQLHGKFGGVLLKRWNFPSIFIQVALYHDAPASAPRPSRELLVASFANSLAKSRGYKFGPEEKITMEEDDAARQLQIAPDLIEVIGSQLIQQIGSLESAIV